MGGYFSSTKDGVPTKGMFVYLLTLGTPDPLSSVTLKSDLPQFEEHLFEQKTDDIRRHQKKTTMSFWQQDLALRSGKLTVDLVGGSQPLTYEIRNFHDCDNLAPINAADDEHNLTITFFQCNEPLNIENAFKFLSSLHFRGLQALCKNGLPETPLFLAHVNLTQDEWSSCYAEGPGCKRRMVEAIVNKFANKIRDVNKRRSKELYFDEANDNLSQRQDSITSESSKDSPGEDRLLAFKKLCTLPLNELQSVCLAPTEGHLKLMNRVDWINSHANNRREMLEAIHLRMFPGQNLSFHDVIYGGEETCELLDEFLELKTYGEPEDHMFPKDVLVRWNFSVSEIAFCCDGRSYDDQLTTIESILDDKEAAIAAEKAPPDAQTGNEVAPETAQETAPQKAIEKSS